MASQRDFGKCLEVGRVECVDSPDAVGLHGGKDLQIEYVDTRHGTAAKQAHPSLDRVGGNRQHMKKGK